jgi:hypothetical protein
MDKEAVLSQELQEEMAQAVMVKPDQDEHA